MKREQPSTTTPKAVMADLRIAGFDDAASSCTCANSGGNTCAGGSDVASVSITRNAVRAGTSSSASTGSSSAPIGSSAVMMAPARLSFWTTAFFLQTVGPVRKHSQQIQESDYAHLDGEQEAVEDHDTEVVLERLVRGRRHEELDQVHDVRPKKRCVLWKQQLMRPDADM